MLSNLSGFNAVHMRILHLWWLYRYMASWHPSGLGVTTTVHTDTPWRRHGCLLEALIQYSDLVLDVMCHFCG